VSNTNRAKLGELSDEDLDQISGGDGDGSEAGVDYAFIGICGQGPGLGPGSGCWHPIWGPQTPSPWGEQSLNSSGFDGSEIDFG
jgi:hypothetical protein